MQRLLLNFAVTGLAGIVVWFSVERAAAGPMSQIQQSTALEQLFGSVNVADQLVTFSAFQANPFKTLNDVVITIDFHAQVYGYLNNYPSGPQDFTIQAGVSGSIQLTQAPYPTISYVAPPVTQTLTNITPASLVPFGPLPTSATATMTFTSPTDLAFYQGGISPAFLLESDYSVTVPLSIGTGGVNVATQTRVTVEYDYTAVAPEPASLTLLGIGIAGMVGYGWRQRKAAAPVR